jgi:hypothetical protein
MNNPLKRFKNNDAMLEWSNISESTNIKIQTLISIASKDSKKIGNISLINSERLKRTIGVDMGKYLEI